MPPKKIQDVLTTVKKTVKRKKKTESPLSAKDCKIKLEKRKDGSKSSSKVSCAQSRGIPKGNKYIGAHVSISGQRSWKSSPLEETVADRFKQTLEEYGYSPHMVVPHGSYLMNCGSPDDVKLKKSRDMLVDELKRCQMLGLPLFNFHPGSTCGEITVTQAMDKIAKSIDMAHSKTEGVITVLENMCRQGHTIGGDFTELRGIIDRVKDKSRVGVCLDTCHAFAAGYELRTQEGYKETMNQFDKIVGFSYLKAVHVNDSKGDLGCHLDRHENIGKGKIGLAGFRRIMNDDRLNNIPFVLETPSTDYAKEIKLLYSLCEK